MVEPGLLAGDVVNVVMSVSGRSISDVAVVDVPLSPAVSLRTVLQTQSTVYADNAVVEIMYQLLGANGETLVDSLGLDISIIAEAGGIASSHVCSAPTASSGVGRCSMSLPADWFALYDTSEVYVNVAGDVEFNSSRKEISMPAYVIVLPASPSVSLVLPASSLYRSDAFTAPIEAFTGDQSLTVWDLTIEYDYSLLEFETFTTSDLYSDAVVSTVPGSIHLSTSGVHASVSASEVSGDHVGIGFVRFKVRSDAAAGVHDGAVDIVAHSLVNTFSLMFASDVIGATPNGRGGNSLTVVSNEAVAIYAHVVQSELINTAAIDNVSASVPISVSGIFNQQSVDLTTSNGVVCSVDPVYDTVVSISECSISVTAAHVHGADSIAVSVAYGNLTTVVFVRVWYASLATVRLKDSVLNSVHIDTAGECTNSSVGTVYQYTTASVFVTLSGSGLVDRTVDMTDRATLVASTDSVVDVNKEVVQGVTVGQTDITVVSFNPSSLVVVPATIKVSSTAVFVNSLTVAVFTNAVVVPSSLAVRNGHSSPTFEVHQILSNFGDVGYIQVVATFEDGKFNDISSLVSIEALNPFIVVGNDAQGPLISVAPSAEPFKEDAVLATWSLCPDVNISGLGMVLVTLPSAVSVSLSISSPIFTTESNPATNDPFNVPSFGFLSVVVLFSDGSTQSFTSPAYDDQAVFSILDGSANLNLVDNRVDIVDNATIGDTFIIGVSFPGLYGLSANVSASIVGLSHVTLDSFSYPACIVASTLHQSSKTEIFQIGCSGEYQRLNAVVFGVLSDGSSKEITGFSSISSNVTSVAAFSSHSVLGGIAPGVTYLEAEYHSVFSNTLMVSVSSGSVHLTALAISPDALSTITGTIGFTTPLGIRAEFNDSTCYADIVSGSASAFVSVDELLTLSSDLPSVLSVSNSGILTLHGNHFTSVEISATDICASVAPLEVAAPFYANLMPLPYDVDMGSVVGPPFGTVTVGDIVTFPVRVRSGQLDITSFQVIVTFNSDLVKVLDDDQCEQGADWSGAWDCTTNDPIDQVLIAGACGLEPSSLCNTVGEIEIATISFVVLQSGLNPFSEFIVRIQDAEQSATGVAALAGTDDMMIVDVGQTARARELSLLYQPSYARINSTFSKLYDHSSKIRRTSSLCDSCHAGDVNGDCVVDSADVLALQLVLGGVVPVSSLSSCQVVGLDPDRNGVVNGVDIQFLLRTVTKKYRILAYLSTQVSDSGVALTTTFRDASNTIVNTSLSVQYDVQTILNRQMNVSVGTNVTRYDRGISSFGVLDDATHSGFSMVGDAVYDEGEVGVMFVLRTTDARGLTSDARIFPYYCSSLLSFCTAVFGGGDNAFKPYFDMNITTAAPAPATPIPTFSPSTTPTVVPTTAPSLQAPTGVPSSVPSSHPSSAPTSIPTTSPTNGGESRPPTSIPTSFPSVPTSVPSSRPSNMPTIALDSLIFHLVLDEVHNDNFRRPERLAFCEAIAASAVGTIPNDCNIIDNSDYIYSNSTDDDQVVSGHIHTNDPTRKPTLAPSSAAGFVASGPVFRMSFRDLQASGDIATTLPTVVHARDSRSLAIDQTFMSVIVTFQLLLSPRKLGFANNVTMKANINGQLQSAVNSGLYTTYLRTYAQVFGATGLFNVNIRRGSFKGVGFSANPTSAPTSTPSISLPPTSAPSMAPVVVHGDPTSSPTEARFGYFNDVRNRATPYWLRYIFGIAGVAMVAYAILYRMSQSNMDMREYLRAEIEKREAFDELEAREPDPTEDEDYQAEFEREDVADVDDVPVPEPGIGEALKLWNMQMLKKLAKIAEQTALAEQRGEISLD